MAPACQLFRALQLRPQLDGVHTGPQSDQPQEGSHAGGELGQGPMELAADRMERPVPFSAGLGGRTADMIHKFHSTRPMAEEYKSEILHYILHISNRGEESNTLHNILSKLSDYLLRLCGPSRASDALEEATARNIAGAVGKQTASSHSLEGKGSTKGDDRSASQQRTNAGPRPVLQPLQLYLSNPLICAIQMLFSLAFTG